jgi:hypothetical protein
MSSLSWKLIKNPKADTHDPYLPEGPGERIQRKRSQGAWGENAAMSKHLHSSTTSKLFYVDSKNPKAEHGETRVTPINLALVKAPRGWELVDYTPILESHVPETRRLIYSMTPEPIKKGELNAEGNVELLVVGHAGTLSVFNQEARQIRQARDLKKTGSAT